MNDIVFRAIGVIRTPFGGPGDAPRRPGGTERGEVEVFPEFRDGLREIEGFSHILLVFHLHRSEGGSLLARPPGETVPHGVFATRSPHRPNPIGVSPVRLVSVDDGILTVEGVDMLDGTPLLDIKPYIPYVRGEVRLGWLDEARRRVSAGRANAGGADVAVRPFTMDDHEEVLNLWASTGAEHSPAGRDSREHIEREISRPTSIFIVAEADGRIVGTVFGTHDGRKGWINRLVVHPAWRRRGIATRLVREVEERLEGMGIEIVAALIWKWNRVSRLVFERMGYVPAEDCIYYSKRRHRDV